MAQVRADTNFVELLDANPWLKSTKLVVKPDMLFGKRGKHDLVGLNLDFSGVEAFIKARMGKVSLSILHSKSHDMPAQCGELEHTYRMMMVQARYLAGADPSTMRLSMPWILCRWWTWMAALDPSTPLWWSHLSRTSRSTTSAYR